MTNAKTVEKYLLQTLFYEAACRPWSAMHVKGYMNWDDVRLIANPALLVLTVVDRKAGLQWRIKI